MTELRDQFIEDVNKKKQTPILMLKKPNSNYIAEHLGMSNWYFSNIVNGRDPISDEKLQTLIDKLKTIWQNPKN